MLYTEICNLPWLYILVAVILLVVIAQTLIMMRKAWKHARELGLDDKKIRLGVTNGILVSIVPTIPVIVVFLSLVPLLGGALPWLRLSVIGSATFEFFAASNGVLAAGEEFALGAYTIKGWVAAAWCMTIGASISLILAIVFTKPVSKLYSKAGKVNVDLITVIGLGCLMGVMAYAVVAFGLADVSTSGIIFMISFAVGCVILLILKKFPKMKWLNDFLMAICMIISMVVACVIF